MRAQTLSRRALYLAVAVAMVASTAGFVGAAVLSSTAVNEGANFYQGGNNGANGYTSPTLKVTTTPVGTSVCSGATVTDSTTAGTANVIFSSTTGSTTCTAGNFAQEFTLSFSATISTQSNVVTITTQVGAGSVETNSATLTLGTGSSGAFTATVNVYVDYGAVNPPAGGVTVLDLVVQ
ncbi:MAG TPA: hypothetical protein VJQ43_06195 [Thermoplasmata archaeon]|nr:hypothetical protein [Thermoplasmata archaeon]